MAGLLEVLMVEDNPADVELARIAFSEGQFDNHLDVVENGELALDYLYQREPFAETSRPDIILLDLNLPKISGYQVLEAIKSDSVLSLIPVIVFSSSLDKRDIQSSYALKANGYINKPVSVQEFLDVVNSIKVFWANSVCLPRH